MMFPLRLLRTFSLKSDHLYSFGHLLLCSAVHNDLLKMRVTDMTNGLLAIPAENLPWAPMQEVSIQSTMFTFDCHV